MKEYEASRSNENVTKVNDRKNSLIQRLEKNKSELNILLSSSNEAATIAKIEEGLKKDEEKLQALLSDQANSGYVQKLQAELQQLETELQVTKKKREDISRQIESARQENGKLQTRLESLQKDVTIYRIQIKNEETKKHAKVEAAELSMLIQGEIDFAILEISDVSKASKGEVEELHNSLQARLKKLQLKEDEFNRNAALVPENDPNVTLINDKILSLKENVEKISGDKVLLMADYKRINEARTEKFIAFFD